VLATEVGGIRDLVVENINGNYFNFTKIDLLVDLINYYNGNRHLLNILGNNGFEMVNTRFSINKMIEQLENVYNSA
jgi:glycosyltransferase involved in cell wall biosynthesis